MKDFLARCLEGFRGSRNGMFNRTLVQERSDLTSRSNVSLEQKTRDPDGSTDCSHFVAFFSVPNSSGNMGQLMIWHAICRPLRNRNKGVLHLWISNSNKVESKRMGVEKM